MYVPPCPPFATRPRPITKVLRYCTRAGIASTFRIMSARAPVRCAGMGNGASRAVFRMFRRCRIMDASGSPEKCGRALVEHYAAESDRLRLRTAALLDQVSERLGHIAARDDGVRPTHFLVMVIAAIGEDLVGRHAVQRFQQGA